MGLPGTPATRATRPPAAGPMLRYFRALNSFGDSGLPGLAASWPAAPSEMTASASAPTVIPATLRAKSMRASLSSADEAHREPAAAPHRHADAAVADRHERVHLR